MIRVKVKMPCEKCLPGEMVFNGLSTPGSGGRRHYHHKCKTCGHHQVFMKEYPYFEELEWVEEKKITRQKKFVAEL